MMFSRFFCSNYWWQKAALGVLTLFFCSACSDAVPTVGFLNKEDIPSVKNSNSQVFHAVAQTEGFVGSASSPTYKASLSISASESTVRTTANGHVALPTEINHE